ncbi:O-antigen polysaccharide polymerase Wzy [Priestia endophytica]|uniref:O-antigen polysaccharide polymerase Wzy n=1 Tax=Priestia endophytica TaxID=135735 RepID=UPI002E1CF028|nr:O-antigen polysaccharide polymerase Wzy [Priestia endophytica]
MGKSYTEKIDRTSYTQVLAWCIFIVFYMYCLLAFIKLFPHPSPIAVSWLSLIISIVCLYIFKKNKRIATFGLTSVLLLYTILTQFGLGTIYYLLGPQFLVNYTSYTLRFLFSDQYVPAVLLGMIAVMTYTLSMSLGSLKGEPVSERLNRNSKSNSIAQTKLAVYTGYIFLVIVFLYFAFLLVSGTISFSMNYSSFRDGVIRNNGMFSYMLVLYATGISYIISTGNRKQIKIGLFIYCFTAIILLITGNKGEVLYAILACIGVSQYRGLKIKPRLLIFLSTLLFIIIPFITSVRQKGVLNSLGQIGFSFTDSFIEMGFQLRVSVYVLEQFSLSTREFIYGFSYYNPIINIIDRFIPFIPFKLETPSSFDFKTSPAFSGQGFSQVAESYANFGLFGTIFFFLIIGYVVSKIESKSLRPLQLAYFTSIIVILINVTRNSFAFVPGQILLMTLLFFFLNSLIKKKYQSIKTNDNPKCLSKL